MARPRHGRVGGCVTALNIILTYLSRVFIASSILLNAFLGGKNNQTTSAGQWARKRENKFNCVWLIDKIFWWEQNHCEESWIKWTIINSAINQYDNLAHDYYTRYKVK